MRWRLKQVSIPGRSAFLLLLLLTSFGIMLVLAWQVLMAQRSHYGSAHAVVTDYSELAAETYQQRLSTSAGLNVLYQLMQTPIANPPKALSEVVDSEGLSASNQAFIKTITGFVDVSDNQMQLLAGNIQNDQQTLVTRVVMQCLEQTDSVLLSCYDHTDHHPAVIVIVMQQSDDNGKSLRRALILDPTQLSDYYQAVLDLDSLLPRSIGNGQLDNQSIFLQIKDATEQVIFTSSTARSFYETSAQVIIQGDYAGLFQGFQINVSMDPALADELIIGGLPTNRLPLLMTLLLLNLIVILAAILLLRHERRVLAMRGEFIARVSHELRTPLTQIRMYVESLLLDRMPSANEQLRALEIIQCEALRLSHLVDNVLNFSPSREPTIVTELVEIEPELQRVVSAFAPIARQREAQIVVTIDTPVQLCIDSAIWQRIITNLLVNAVKYGPFGQIIELSVDTQDSHLRLQVCDQGPGIPPAEQDNIWQAYYRLPAHQASATAGTGIGLAIVHELVICSHGSINVRNRSSGGACFTVLLPLNKNDTEVASI